MTDKLGAEFVDTFAAEGNDDKTLEIIIEIATLGMTLMIVPLFNKCEWQLLVREKGEISILIVFFVLL